MGRAKIVSEGFSLILPLGWSEIVDEHTFSDPDQIPPRTFAREEGPGVVYVSPILFHPDEQPSDEPEQVEALAIDWGSRRGQPRPLACSSERRADGCLSSATFQIGGEFVQIWFLSDGESVVHASYVC